MSPRTGKSLNILMLLLLLAMGHWPLHLHAQKGPVNEYSDDAGNEDDAEEQPTEEQEEEAKKRPTQTDNTSAKLIALNEKIMGGRELLKALEGYEIKYFVREGKKEFFITITKTRPSNYRIDKTWRFLGRNYHEVMSFDGTYAWKQTLLPESSAPKPLDKKERLQFISDSALLGPLFMHEEKSHVFVYGGEGKVSQRPAYIVKGYLVDGRRNDYYFDKENYLINRMTTDETFAGQKTRVDRYVMKRAQRSNYFWDEEVSWYVNGKAYRTESMDSVRINPMIDPLFFSPPKQREYWLKQDAIGKK